MTKRILNIVFVCERPSTMGLKAVAKCVGCLTDAHDSRRPTARMFLLTHIIAVCLTCPD